MKCAEILNPYKKNQSPIVNIGKKVFDIHNSNKNVNRMHFGLLFGIEPKLLISLLAAIEIVNMDNVDFAIKLIPASLVSVFTIHRWIVFYKKNKKLGDDE